MAFVRRVVLAALCALPALALFASGVAYAQEAEGASPTPGAAIPGGWDWVGLGLRLALVLFAIWIVVVGMRWYLKRHGVAPGGGRAHHLQVLETRSLGGQRSLQLVRLGGRAVLVGVTAERITPLLSVDDPEEFALLTAAPEPRSETRSFSGLLSGMTDSLARLPSRRSVRPQPERTSTPPAASMAAAPTPAPATSNAQAALAAISAARGRVAANAYRGMRLADLQAELEASGTELPR